MFYSSEDGMGREEYEKMIEDNLIREPEYYTESKIIEVIHRKEFTNYAQLARYINIYDYEEGVTMEDILYMVMEHPQTLRLIFDGNRRELDFKFGGDIEGIEYISPIEIE